MTLTRLAVGLTTMLSVGATLVMVDPTATPASAAAPATPERIHLTQSDLEFIIAQIKISEAHPDGTGILCTAPDRDINPLACTNQVPNTVLPYGLRQVDGRNNNLVPGDVEFGAADTVFPRLTTPVWATADALTFDPDGPGPLKVGSPTSYTQNTGIVVDADPRIISNLISDQTRNNPAARPAALAVDGHGFTFSTVKVDHDHNPDTEPIVQYVLPNVAPDGGYSPSYNTMFTLFGQFFDHGLDLTQKGGNGTVFVPLKSNDPLYVKGSPTNFMVLTRATNQPGADGVLGTADDVKDANNLVTPYIDNNQTYTSHPSQQVFHREYVLDTVGRPMATGRLLDGANGGLATWADMKAQARTLLGIELADQDVTSVPLLATDVYGNFLPGANGFPQIVTADGLVEGDPAAPVSPTAVGALRAGHAFLDDIAHHAVPGTWDNDRDPATPPVAQVPDTDTALVDDGDPSTYDNEMLDAHYMTGDGRGNENIGLTAIHDVFHVEHNLLVGQIQDLVATLPANSPAALVNWLHRDGSWNGERLFQAAKFVNEMEYQHLVFGEFARAVQPTVDLFNAYDPTKNPAISAEFAHSVYRFGHSMLTETIDRINADGSDNPIDLMSAFLNPPELTNGGSAGQLSPADGVAAVLRGAIMQRGEEIDEFITTALRSNLVGLPLDLAALNIARGRSEGIAPLNSVRRELYANTVSAGAADAALKPYFSWATFGIAMRHPDSLMNFIAAYGTHPSILRETSMGGKRNAAEHLIKDGSADARDFMNSTGAWAPVNGRATTGLEDIDLWIGGLAEGPPAFGGMLGTTFNFVFEHQMEALQSNDRMYYLARTAGLPLLAELEGNTFSDLIRRTTSLTDVPVLAFTRPDYQFFLDAQTDPSAIVDDPATPYDERNLDDTSKLIRSDGAILLTGKGTTENHAAWYGTAGADHIVGAEGDDSMWGNDGDDTLEAGIGNDTVNGGDGRDIILDSVGDDIFEGGDGSDVISGGKGLDLLLGGNGADAIFHGTDDKESFGGAGDDLVAGGTGADGVVGGSGEDWIEGGPNGDFLVGDDNAPFAVLRGEDDVLIGDGGDDGYLGEGGMDIFMAGSGVDRVVGDLGFDWVSYARSYSGVTVDLRLPPGAGGLVNPRDRFQLVEGLAGGPFDDDLRGDDKARVVGNELKASGIAKIDGLAELLDAAGVLVNDPASSYLGDDILFGGGGSDIIEGGGGDDFIDGDSTLDVYLTCVNQVGDTLTFDRMSSLQTALLDRTIDPETCDIHRAIVRSTDPTSIDTALYRYPMAEYSISQLPNGTLIVSHAPCLAPGGGAGGGGCGGGGGGGGGGVVVGGGLVGGGVKNEGTDRLVNIERLQFLDGTFNPVSSFNQPAEGFATILNQQPAVGAGLAATVQATDPEGIDNSTMLFEWESESDPDVWTVIAQGTTFVPTDAELGKRLRMVVSFLDLTGNPESVWSAPTLPVVAVIDPTVTPLLTMTVPQDITSSALTLSAVLTVPVNGQPQPLADTTVTFVVDGQTLAALTDANGIASTPVVLGAAPDTTLVFSASAVLPDATLVEAAVETRTANYPTVTLAPVVSVAEGAAGEVTPLVGFAVLDRPAAQDITISWTATGITATDGDDLDPVDGTIVVPAGETTAPLTVAVLGDAATELDETVQFTITAADGGHLGADTAQVGTILNDDMPVASLGEQTPMAEGSAEFPGALTVSVSLDQPAPYPVTVDVSTSALTAEADVDFVPTTATVTFEPGVTTATTSVPFVGDATPEENETFDIALTGATGATIGTANATGTILNDDLAQVGFATAPSSIEGSALRAGSLTFVLTLDVPSTIPVIVDWQTTDGTGQADTDYVAASGTVTFAPGSQSAVVTVALLGDATPEPDESVQLELVNVINGTIATASQAGAVLNDDLARVSFAPAPTAAEGSQATPGTLSFTLTLDVAASIPVTVRWQTADGTGRAGTDYVAASGTATFEPGSQSVTVDVALIGDALLEADETVDLQLVSVTNGSRAAMHQLGTIANDDLNQVTLDAGPRVVEGGTGVRTPLTFTARLTAPSATPVTFTWKTTGGTATAPEDFGPTSGTVTIPAGATSATFSLTVAGDVKPEADETVTVAITGVSAGAAVGPTATSTGTIADDDTTFVTVANISKAEGSRSASTFTFTLTLSKPLAKAGSVVVSTVNGTAMSSSDFKALTNLTVKIPAGARTVTVNVNVSVTADRVKESDETFQLVLKSATGLSLGANASAIATIVNDD